MPLIDHYDRQARLLPAVIVLLPLAIGALPWLNGEETGWALIGRVGLTGLVTLAIATLLMGLARSAGVRKQRWLWNRWGGSPTLIMMRHGYKELSPVTRGRYHAVIAKALKLSSFPSAADEDSNPEKADEVYKAGIDYMINRTRDVKLFPLLYKENVNYGFHRNLWALRPAGITLAVLGTGSCGARVWLDWWQGRHVNVFAITAGLACFALLLVWLTLITSDWVRGPAFAYARMLLAATENIAEAKAG